MTDPASADELPVFRLAAEQLRCYNAADLDGFCSCYADNVRVLDADGSTTTEGMATFRENYARLFERFTGVRARVETRLAVGDHAIDHEFWERTDRETGETTGGEILVRYTHREGRIAIVEFLR